MAVSFLIDASTRETFQSINSTEILNNSRKPISNTLRVSSIKCKPRIPKYHVYNSRIRECETRREILYLSNIIPMTSVLELCQG